MESVRLESILKREITWARIVALLCLVTAAAGTAQEAYFDEDFSDDTANPNVTGWDSFAVTNGVLRLASDAGNRGYIRTVNSDYNTRDFVAELTLTCKLDILHFGIGQRGENEPDNSVTFRIHPLVHEGQIRVRTAQTEFNIGRVVSTGPHRVRIRKLRHAITFALDERYDGDFEADMSVTFADLAEVGSFLNDRNSRIFFSTSRPEEELDDFFIRPLNPVHWDCNRNGNEDAADLAAGSSLDANGDAIPDECAQEHHYFGEDFNEPVRNSSLEGYGSFYSIESGVVRRTGYLNTPFRSNLRTVKTDYNTKDFIFEVSFTTAARDINLIGIGPGNGPDEPALSVYMRVHPQVYEGQLGIQTGLGYDLLPSLKTAGPHRARIEKRGSKISFAIDEMFDGSFHADMSKTYNDLRTIAPFLNDRNSNLFFGGAFEDDWYDDVSIRDPATEIVDCNRNSIPDAQDIASETSRDIEGDGVPDECQLDPLGSIRIEPVGLRCVEVVLTVQAAARGGELGIAYDPQRVWVTSVSPGPDFPAAGELRSQLEAPRLACADSLGIEAGLTIGWFAESGGQVPAGIHRLVKICFALAPGATLETCSPLRFVECLGVPLAPVVTIATDEAGFSRRLEATDGEICVRDDQSFRRGDANGDGQSDISDPIGILGCLFLGTPCLGCEDTQDANDDGLVNIGDAVFLLVWRFGNGSAPRPPFPECGSDPTVDPLRECENSVRCR